MWERVVFPAQRPGGRRGCDGRAERRRNPSGLATTERPKVMAIPRVEEW